MGVRIGVAKLSGLSSSTWSYVHEFSPTDEKFSKRGQLVVAVSLPGEGGVEAVEKGRGILSQISNTYYKDEARGSFDQLKEAVEGLHEEGLGVAAAAFVPEEGGVVVHLAGLGGGEVWVKRQGIMGRVLRSEQVETASGRIKEGEVVVLGTKAFFLMAVGRLQAAVGSGDFQAAAESLAPIVEGQEGAAGAVVGVISEAEVEKLGDRAVPEPKKFKIKLPEIGKHSRAVFVGAGEKKKGTAVKIVGLVLLVLLSGSLLLGGKERVKREQEKKFGSRVAGILEKVATGESMAEVSPGEARQILAEAKEEAESVISEGYEGEDVRSALNKAGEVLGAISGEVNANPETYMDLTLVREGMVGDRLAYSLGNLMVLDISGKRQIMINGETKSAQAIAGGDKMNGAKLQGAYGERGFVLVDGGVLEEEEIVIEKDEQWGEIGAMEAYGGNLYLLDKSNGEVWRYPGAEGGVKSTAFGARQAWINEGIEVDFSKVNDMSIDGWIWVGTESGNILKLALGTPEVFTISGLTKGHGSVTRLETNDEAEHLYILDRDNKRVIAANKETGEYKNQYLWDGMGEVTDLAVDEGSRRMWLLSGSKIYLVGLK